MVVAEAEELVVEAKGFVGRGLCCWEEWGERSLRWNNRGGVRRSRRRVENGIEVQSERIGVTRRTERRA